MRTYLMVEYTLETIYAVLKGYLHINPHNRIPVHVGYTGSCDIIGTEVDFCYGFDLRTKFIDVFIYEVLHFFLVLHFPTTVELIICFSAVMFQKAIEDFLCLWKEVVFRLRKHSYILILHWITIIIKLRVIIAVILKEFLLFFFPVIWHG